MAAFDRIGPNAADPEQSKKPAAPTSSQAAAIVQRALKSKGALPPGAILQLQRVVGNRAVVHLAAGPQQKRVVTGSGSFRGVVQRNITLWNNPRARNRLNVTIKDGKEGADTYTTVADVTAKLTELTRVRALGRHIVDGSNSWHCFVPEEDPGAAGVDFWAKHAERTSTAGGNASIYGTTVTVRDSRANVSDAWVIPHYHAFRSEFPLHGLFSGGPPPRGSSLPAGQRLHIFAQQDVNLVQTHLEQLQDLPLGNPELLDSVAVPPQ